MLLDNYKKQSPIVGVAGLGGGINSYIFLSSGGDYVISKSLRFNSGDSAYLNRTPSSASNRKTWTWSGWVKRSDISATKTLWASSTLSSIRFATNSEIEWLYEGNYGLKTNAVFRDISAWYHFVFVLDTTNATADDRQKIYVNGTQLTSFASRGNPSLNSDKQWNAASAHAIGAKPDASVEFDGYLADVHFIDGQALSPTDFGKFDTSGVWQPKKYSGAHGTNGFHLDFKDNSSNAALGNDAAGSNNFTVNNLTASSTPVNTVAATSGLLGTDINVTVGSYNFAHVDSDIGSDPGDQAYVKVNFAALGLTAPATITFNSYQQGGGGWSVVGNTVYTDAGNTTSSFTYSNNTRSNTVNIPAGATYFAIPPSWTSASGGILSNGINNLVWDGVSVSYYDGSDGDSLLDSPSQNVADETDSGVGGEITGNYATLNPLALPGGGTLSDGNLKYSSGGGWDPTTATIGLNSGKWYWEYLFEGTNMECGITAHPNTDNWIGNYQGSLGIGNGGEMYLNGDGGTNPSGWSTIATGSIVGNELDLDNGTFRHYINGVVAPSYATQSLDTSLTWFPAGSVYGSSHLTYNFGQRAFAYTAPTNFKALNTASLPTPTIEDGSKYFDTKLYTGNGGTQSITMDNSALSPDFVWIKCRNDAIEHQLFDTVRGALKSLRSDSSAVEATVANSLTDFDSNGFTLGSAQSVNHTKTFASWVWDAGANSNRTYAVTVVSSGGNKYRFDGNGDNAVTLDLAEGSTYIFDQSDNSNSGHPLRFSTTSNGSHGGGSEYTTGVTVTGTPGSAGAKTTIVIAASAPTLYYYCTAHSGMGGQINTNSTEGSTILSGGLNSSVYDQSQTWSSSVTSDNGFAGASYGATQAFNGTTSGNHTASNSNGTLTFAPNLTIPANSVIEGHFGSGSTAYMDVTVNGVANNSTAGGEFVKVNYNGSTTLTSLTITRTGGGNSADLRGLKINGVLLVDSGVTPPNVPSVTTILKANPEAGFSISRYPGAGAVSTIAHGLNTAPSMFIQKRITNSDSWHVYHIGAGNTKYARLENTDDFQVRTGNWNNTSPTSSVVTLGDDGGVNGSGNDYLALCFAPISGYSAMGTYTGNGNADGIFIYTGFTPSWILFKRSDSTSDWSIYDTARDPDNVAGNKLEPNTTDTESSSATVDILSNGFKFRRNSLENGGNDVYIYMAFASRPFKSSRAR